MGDDIRDIELINDIVPIEELKITVETENSNSDKEERTGIFFKN